MNRIRPTEYVKYLQLIDPKASTKLFLGNPIKFRTCKSGLNHVLLQIYSSYFYYYDPETYFFLVSSNEDRMFLFRKEEIDKCGTQYKNGINHNTILITKELLVFPKNEITKECTSNRIRILDKRIRFNENKEPTKKERWIKENELRILNNKKEISYQHFCRKDNIIKQQHSTSSFLGIDKTIQTNVYKGKKTKEEESNLSGTESNLTITNNTQDEKIIEKDTYKADEIINDEKIFLDYTNIMMNHYKNKIEEMANKEE